MIDIPNQGLGIAFPDTAFAADAVGPGSPPLIDITALIDALPSPVAVLNCHGEIVAVSEAWRRIACDTREDALAACGVGQNYLKSCLRMSGLRAKDAHDVSVGIQAVLDGELPLFTFEYSYPIPDQLTDQQRWVLIQASSVRDGMQGAVVELADITARKLAEAERKPVWPSDRFPPSVAEQQRLATVAVRAPLSRAETDARRFDAVDATRDPPGGRTYVRNANGSALRSNRALHEIAGGVAERQRLLGELAEARSRERAAAEEVHNLELFMAMAAHELRTPLAVIKSYLNGAEQQMVSYLEQAGSPQDGSQVLTVVQHAIQNARQDALQMGSLLEDLLQVSRARVGKVVVHPQLCDLGGLIRQVVLQQHQLQPARCLTFHLRRNQHILVDADPALTRQVLTNLLDNARKYSPEDRPVDVYIAVIGHMARVSVRDRGPGLPLEEQARIWDCFYQAPGVRYQPSHCPGLGLGLYVTRLIIDQHGGHVGVESKPGRGSTFWFTLPLAEVPLGEVPRQPPTACA